VFFGLATAGGTATPFADYQPISGFAAFPAGFISGATFTFGLSVLNDSDVEEDETVLILLSQSSSNAVVKIPNTHTVTIKDDDQAILTFETASLLSFTEPLAPSCRSAI
jgi:hypothetical protein